MALAQTASYDGSTNTCNGEDDFFKGANTSCVCLADNADTAVRTITRLCAIRDVHILTERRQQPH